MIHALWLFVTPTQLTNVCGPNRAFSVTFVSHAVCSRAPKMFAVSFTFFFFSSFWLDCITPWAKIRDPLTDEYIWDFVKRLELHCFFFDTFLKRLFRVYLQPRLRSNGPVLLAVALCVDGNSTEMYFEVGSCKSNYVAFKNKKMVFSK